MLGEIIFGFEWQSSLFKKIPSRHETSLIKCKSNLDSIFLNITRNHGFEHVATSAQKWLAWWGKALKTTISPYDDSLSFRFHRNEVSDVELIWIDLDRYTKESYIDWISSRISFLRTIRDVPIIVVALGSSVEDRNKLKVKLEEISSLLYVDAEESLACYNLEIYSERNLRLAGTRLTDSAILLLARELACRWLPYALNILRKAIVVDLDNTLYSGVLGEQGAEGVELTTGHEMLQRQLKALKNRGFFLAISSRNLESDVRSLFANRLDFPLKWDDFSAHSISWEDKATGLSRIAEQLRIGLDSLVFIDDNPGELNAVGFKLPEVGLIHANSDPTVTSMVVDYFPGLWKFKTTKEDQLRTVDLRANTHREDISKSSGSPAEYLRNLQASIDFFLDNKSQVSRMVELSQKTNQFNLSMSRFSETDFARILQSECSHVVTFQLKDRLSDSGLIGLIVLDFHEGMAIVRELAISCRALGRGLEDLMISKSLECALGNEFYQAKLFFNFRRGQRNQPAISWLQMQSSKTLEEQGRAAIILDTRKINSFSDVVKIKFYQNE
jgi:FkbH-like protein